MSLSTNQLLPDPPKNLFSGDVALHFSRCMPGDKVLGFAPYYHFKIMLENTTAVGHINFRVGDTQHVRLYAGHIGFEINESYRGNHYARQACRAIAPCVRILYTTVVITCDPENMASRRTIESIGAHYVNTVSVPPGEAHYLRGSRHKMRYHWTP